MTTFVDVHGLALPALQSSATRDRALADQIPLNVAATTARTERITLRDFPHQPGAQTTAAAPIRALLWRWTRSCHVQLDQVISGHSLPMRSTHGGARRPVSKPRT